MVIDASKEKGVYLWLKKKGYIHLLVKGSSLIVIGGHLPQKIAEY